MAIEAKGSWRHEPRRRVFIIMKLIVEKSKRIIF